MVREGRKTHVLAAGAVGSGTYIGYRETKGGVETEVLKVRKKERKSQGVSKFECGYFCWKRLCQCAKESFTQKLLTDQSEGPVGEGEETTTEVHIQYSMVRSYTQPKHH